MTESNITAHVILYQIQDKIFRCKRLNFINVYIEIWDKGILRFNKFSM